ncbi:MAG: phosphotransferase [Flavobacteriia bacterium]|nr:phosphotransferase [Flavobacteriia bacterium]
MDTELQKFLTDNYGLDAADSLIPLAQSGSSRKYYRFEFQNNSLILTQSDNIEENKTFVYFTSHFSKITDHLPKIDKISPDLSIYTQTDLGNLSLMNLIEDDREKSKEIFKKSIRQLVRLQVLGDKGLDYSKCFSYQQFNYLLVLRDLFSFKNYFLNLSDIEFNHGRLLQDFEKFAHDFEKIPNRYFVFRDFQSRNIMVHNDQPYFIDYQGGLKGPVQYDLVSLIWQAKANLSNEWKQEFYDLYWNELIEIGQNNLDKSEFQKGYQLCLIERLLQVLGTYGFRGIYERKPHFLKSIEFGLKNLNEIKNLELINDYPELKSVIVKLSEPKFFIELKQKING